MGIPIGDAIRELLSSNNKLSDSAKDTLEFLFNTDSGKEAFEKWTIDNEQNQKSKGTENVDFQKLYSGIIKHIENEKQTIERKGLNTLFVTITKVAAILLIPIIICSSILIYRYANRSNDLSEKLASIENYDSDNIIPMRLNYYSPAGSRLKIELADGTKVCLNGNSTLGISRVFGMDQRRVSLTGEALFDVAKDSLRQFVVDAGDISVTALGTSFYVMAYPEDNEIETVLLRGKIAIKTKSSQSEPYILEQNQKYVYKKESSKPSIDKDIEIRQYHAWTEGELIFDNESMADMIKRLEHYYNVSIVVKDDELYTYSFTASLDNCSVEQILEYLKYSSPINYTINKNIITLSCAENKYE